MVHELGPEYSINYIDGEWVAYRKFGNEYDVEISGMNHNSKKKRANIYLWDIKEYPSIVSQKMDVPQCNIGDAVMELYFKARRQAKESS